MYAIKLELKLNNKERSMLAGCSGFKRVVYNFGLELVKNSWQFEDIVASDSKRIAQRASPFGFAVPYGGITVGAVSPVAYGGKPSSCAPDSPPSKRF